MKPRTMDRSPGLLDGLLAELDQAVRILSSAEPAARSMPSAYQAPAAAPTTAAQDPDAPLSSSERALSAALMRVNHAGEVAAQALYRGQALTTADPGVRTALLDAAREEQDHLAWCRQRVRELGSRTSVLGPAWYAGSFALGAVAGLLAPPKALGFIVETERQVEAHLSDHLARLPPGDQASRAVVQQMRVDEAAHGTHARQMGATDLPGPVRQGMKLMARVMTTVAHRL